MKRLRNVIRDYVVSIAAEGLLPFGLCLCIYNRISLYNPVIVAFIAKLLCTYSQLLLYGSLKSRMDIFPEKLTMMIKQSASFALLPSFYMVRQKEM